MRGRFPRAIVGGTLVFSVAMLGLTFSWMGLNEESIRLALRETARVSFGLFMLVYLARSLHLVFNHRFSRFLMVNRRYLGIAFGVSHLVHLAAIATLVCAYANCEPLAVAPWPNWIVGGLGYVFVFALLMTSNDFSVRRLGRKNWQTLHRVGLHYLFFVFLVTLAGHEQATTPLYGLLNLLMLFAFGLRCFVFVRTRGRKISS